MKKDDDAEQQEWSWVEFVYEARAELLIPMLVELEPTNPFGMQRKCARIATITVAMTRARYPAFGLIA